GRRRARGAAAGGPALAALPVGPGPDLRLLAAGGARLVPGGRARSAHAPPGHGPGPAPVAAPGRGEPDPDLADGRARDRPGRERPVRRHGPGDRRPGAGHLGREPGPGAVHGTPADEGRRPLPGVERGRATGPLVARERALRG